jgi:hypothetical protein
VAVLVVCKILELQLIINEINAKPDALTLELDEPRDKDKQTPKEL